MEVTEEDEEEGSASVAENQMVSHIIQPLLCFLLSEDTTIEPI